ncbi:Phospho-2-dehydro-3-deoxyheptonate aldolase 2, chloroplastic [Senna tora]|uniref:Phospho-2-dehydro-3-deoxyheptonate aldolase 2, chloroplastic n=1 Tax=Senna tora TaxID=362788 RepID=A0A835CI32_9FABA|nr:Phospho-2-dehydro-3-deoxyheptonate aldolase 2, chloroplastic [Senna tora]
MSRCAHRACRYAYLKIFEFPCVSLLDFHMHDFKCTSRWVDATHRNVCPRIKRFDPLTRPINSLLIAPTCEGHPINCNSKHIDTLKLLSEPFSSLLQLPKSLSLQDFEDCNVKDGEAKEKRLRKYRVGVYMPTDWIRFVPILLFLSLSAMMKESSRAWDALSLGSQFKWKGIKKLYQDSIEWPCFEPTGCLYGIAMAWICDPCDYLPSPTHSSDQMGELDSQVLSAHSDYNVYPSWLVMGIHDFNELH